MAMSARLKFLDETTIDMLLCTLEGNPYKYNHDKYQLRRVTTCYVPPAVNLFNTTILRDMKK